MRATFLLLACGLAGCGGDDDPSCGEPVYLGDATDEVWRTMVDADDHALDGDPNAPALSEPADGAEISSAGDGLRISWTSPIAAAFPQPVRRRPRRSTGTFTFAGAVDELAARIEGTAWAHLPPVTGDVYWVRVTVPGRSCAVDAITTDLEWTVSGESWDAVRAAAGQTARIDLTSAYLNENRITEGPYRAAPRTVAIGP